MSTYEATENLKQRALSWYTISTQGIFTQNVEWASGISTFQVDVGHKATFLMEDITKLVSPS